MEAEKRARKIKRAFTLNFIISILLLTMPTIMVVTYKINQTLFITCNTVGLILVTIHLVVALATSIGAHAVKGERTEFKRAVDKQAKYLFVVTIMVQFINLTFVHLN